MARWRVTFETIGEPGSFAITVNATTARDAASIASDELAATLAPGEQHEAVYRVLSVHQTAA